MQCLARLSNTDIGKRLGTQQKRRESKANDAWAIQIVNKHRFCVVGLKILPCHFVKLQRIADVLLSGQGQYFDQNTNVCFGEPLPTLHVSDAVLVNPKRP
jgi:hypothetical protein